MSALRRRLQWPCLIGLIGMIGGGLFSLFAGKELCWDLANYHFYSPYAFLHQRQTLDFWPTSYIAQYFNPTLDLLSYYLLTQHSPRAAEFMLGALHGVNLCLIFLIARYFIANQQRNLIAFTLACLSLYGPTAITEIGSFQNDHVIATCVLGFVYLQLRALRQPASRTWPFVAGCCLGAGVGLKLTASVYMVAGVIALGLIPADNYRRRMSSFVFLCLGLCCGIAITAGHWMWHLWQTHHNPIFPFFNDWFHAPDFPATNWRDTRFLPKDGWQTLFYPFYFAWDGRICDLPFRDFRFPVVYLLLLLLGLQRAWRTCEPLNLYTRWFIYFYIAAYICWQWYFSIARYLLPLELLTPLMIVVLVTQLLTRDKARLVALTMIFYTLIYFMIPMSPIRTPYQQQSFFNVVLPADISAHPSAIVFMGYPAFMADLQPRPLQYLIPFFPPTWRFIGVPFLHEQLHLSTRSLAKIRVLSAQQTEDFYVLASIYAMPALTQFVASLHLKPAGACQLIPGARQRLVAEEVLLCRLRRTDIPS